MGPNLKIYNTIILSQINYGMLVWGFQCSRLNKLQKKAIRVTSCSKYNANTDPLFKKLRLLKVEDIFLISKFKFYYRFLKQGLQVNLKNLSLRPNVDIHSHDTRQSRNLFVHR